ncbi:MAG TPA: tautomerase family protein [Acetobacteraceae bacterium]|nr:tautomerase family protein [Acetobacteraceae bacterium]
MLPRHGAKRETSMPEVFVHAIEGRTIEQKRKLVADITDAVVRNFDVSPDAVMVQIIESSRENKAKGGKLFSER